MGRRHVRKPSRSENFRSQHPLPRSLAEGTCTELFQTTMVANESNIHRTPWHSDCIAHCTGFNEMESIIYIYISVRLYCMICNQVSVFHKIGWEHESMEIFPPPNYLNEHRCFDPDDLGENRDAGAQRFKCAGIVGNQGNLWI